MEKCLYRATNNDIIYFKFDNIQPNASYTIFANMVYEYVNTNTIKRLTPWQTWFPIRKDNQLKTIAVNNTRYYRVGSNVWLSADIDITMVNFTQKTHAYISLPPNTHAKNIFFTNAALLNQMILLLEHYTGIQVVM